MKHAVVTGASAGIGAEYVRQLAGDCDSLLLTARREQRLRDLAEKYADHCEITFVAADLQTTEGQARLVEALRQGPPVDLLVNNAGFSAMGPFTDSAIDDELAMIRLHLDATLVLSRAVLPSMRERGSGSIVNVASVGGFMEAPGVATYGATKAFLVSFTRSLAKELADSGIQVQCLCPGYTRTEIHDIDSMAGFDASRVPEQLWMQVDEVVSASLSDLRAASANPARSPILIPGSHNRDYARGASQALTQLIGD